MTGTTPAPAVTPSSASSVAVAPASAQPRESAADGDIDLAEVLEALYRRRRLALTVLFVSMLLGAAITTWQRNFRPVYKGNFRLLVTDPINSEDQLSRSQGSAALESVAIPGGGSTNTTTLIQVLSSPALIAPVEQELQLPPSSLETRLTIGVPRTLPNNPVGSGVLDVSLEWPDPSQGEQILSRLSREFLAYSLRQRQEKLTEGLTFLDQQAPDLQRRVNDLQNRLASFRRASGYVQPEQQAALNLGQRQALESQRDGLQQEQARLQGRLAAVRRGDLGTSLGSSPALVAGAGSLAPAPVAGAAPSSASVASSRAVSATASGGAPAPLSRPVAPPQAPSMVASTPLEELYAVESALAAAQANFTDSAPQVRELKAKRDRLRPMLQRRLQAEIQADLSQNLNQQLEIDRQLAGLKANFRATPAQIKQYESLQQQLDVARNNLSSYIQARENFRLQVAQRTVPWSVISPARFSPTPAKPSLPRNLLLSLLLGTVGGVGIALLRDRLDPVLHDPRELVGAVPLPMLGMVPHLPLGEESTIAAALQASRGSKRFELRESLRNLFTNFRLLRADKTLRLVAITSATQGEGKSTTTALFALTLAQLGQRVLLVDADMRRPTLHHLLGGDNAVGLSSLLTDAHLTLASLVQPIQPGLDLLASGPTPPDTTQLLSSERCVAVVESIRALEGYDFVLFDTPPALLLSDPVLLAEHLDGLLLVVGIERVNRELPGYAYQRIRETGVDILGLLVNQPSRSFRSPRLGYGAGSGYGYGYGYGYAGYGTPVTPYSQADAPPRQMSAAGGDPSPPGGGAPGRRPWRAVIDRALNWIDHRD